MGGKGLAKAPRSGRACALGYRKLREEKRCKQVTLTTSPQQTPLRQLCRCLSRDLWQVTCLWPNVLICSLGRGQDYKKKPHGIVLSHYQLLLLRLLPKTGGILGTPSLFYPEATQDIIIFSPLWEGPGRGDGPAWGLALPSHAWLDSNPHPKRGGAGSTHPKRWQAGQLPMERGQVVVAHRQVLLGQDKGSGTQ